MKKLILPYYAKFLVDDEKELKYIATKNIRVLAGYLDADDIISKIIPVIRTIVSDDTNYIRCKPRLHPAALAESLLSLAPVLGKKNTNDQILSFFLTLLRDDCADVRINIFKTFHELTQVLPASTLIQSILPVFVDSAADKNWKNRVKVLEAMLIFEKELGSEFIEDKQVVKILNDALSDRVYSVRYSRFIRQSAIQTIKKLSKKLGQKWCEKYALQMYMSFINNPNYLYRENALFGLKVEKT